MANNVVVDVPIKVSCALLQDWLDLKGLVALDSALCEKERRRALLRLFQVKELVLRKHATVASNFALSWLTAKKVRAAFLETTVFTSCSIMDTYLSRFGDTVGSVKFGQRTNHKIIGAFIAYSQNLFQVHVDDSKMCGIDFQRLLHVSRNSLVELHIRSMPTNESDVSLLKDIQLTKLRVLSSHNSLYFGEAFKEAINMGKIMKLEVVEKDLDGMEIYQALHTRGKYLRSLGLQKCQLFDSVIKYIAVHSPFIVNLDISDTCVSDDGFGLAMTFLSGLRSLNIQRCTELSSRSLRYIYERHGSTLHTLYLDDHDHFDCAGFATLLQRCNKLRFLNFTQMHYGPSFVFGSSISGLTTLVLDGKAIIDENLIAIGKHCAQLITLSIYHARGGFDTPGYTDAGLHGLIVGCPQLRRLFVRTQFHGVHAPTPFTPALVLKLWRSLKPWLTTCECE